MASKNILLILFSFCLVISSYAQKQSKKNCRQKCKFRYNKPENFPAGFKPHANEKLVMVLNEEFNDKKLNEDLWRIGPPFGNVWPNNVNNKKENVQFTDSTLLLYSKYEPLWAGHYSLDSLGRAYWDSTYTYFSQGLIWSNLRYPEGKFETRCKIPKDSAGLYWPAFWLYGADASEIDVFEFFISSDKFRNNQKVTSKPAFSFHRNHPEDPACWCRYTKTSHQKVDYSLAFHTYSIEWDKFGITWFIDGEVKRFQSFYKTKGGRIINMNKAKIKEGTYNRLETTPDRPHYIIANNSIRTAYVKNNLPIPDSYFEIDYIRAYAWVNCNDTVRLCNVDFGNQENATVIVGGTVELSGKGCTDVLKYGQKLQIYTTGDLIINSGFKKEKGSNFQHFKIEGPE